MRYEHSDNYLFTDDYHLEHYAAGSAKKDAKYSKRIPKSGGGWSYVYESLGNAAREAGNLTKYGIQSTGRKINRSVRNAINRVDTFNRSLQTSYNTASGGKKDAESIKKGLTAVGYNLKGKGGRALRSAKGSITDTYNRGREIVNNYIEEAKKRYGKWRYNRAVDKNEAAKGANYGSGADTRRKTKRYNAQARRADRV